MSVEVSGAEVIVINCVILSSFLGGGSDCISSEKEYKISTDMFSFWGNINFVFVLILLS